MSRTTRTTGLGRVANCATRTRDSPPDPTGTTLQGVLSTTPNRSITRREGFLSSKCSCASPPSAVRTTVFSWSSPRASTDSRAWAGEPVGAAPRTTFVVRPAGRRSRGRPLGDHRRFGRVAALTQRREVDDEVVALEPDGVLHREDVLEFEFRDLAAVHALDGGDPHAFDLWRADPHFLRQPLDLHVQELQHQGTGIWLIGGVAERVVPVQDDLGARRRLLVVNGIDDHRGRRVEHRLTRLADGRIARASQGGRGDRDQDRDLPVPHKLPSSAGVSFFVTSLYGLMLRGSLMSCRNTTVPVLRSMRVILPS